MKTRKMVHVPLIVGLALGLIIMWFGASPAGASGDLVTGGWVTAWIEGQTTAASSYSCDVCDGTYADWCSNYGGSSTCSGGVISVVMCSTYGATSHAGSAGSCFGDPDCADAADGDCY